MSAINTTVCVLGGGPAGAVAGRGMALLGYPTVLIERGRDAAMLRVESLAPSVPVLLDTLALAGAAREATIGREQHALVRWACDDPQVKPFDPPSMLIERARFDAALREAAADAGARIIAGSAGTASRRPGGWTVPVRTLTGSRTVTTRFLIDARGRRPRAHEAVRTAALRGTFARSGLSETRIDTGEAEWLWGSPCGEGRYAATLFVEATRLAGLTREQRRALFLDLVARSPLLHTLAEEALMTPLQVRDATASIADDLISADMVRVGEAAFAIDPLSSQGIQAALLSAIQAIAAVHTMLLGKDAAPAIAFYRAQQRRAAARAARHAADYYAVHARHRPGDFWRRRAGSPGTPPPRVTPAAEVPPRVALSPDLQIVDVPVLAGTTITLAPALSHPALEEPVGYFGGVALAPLIADVRTPAPADAILAGWSGRMPPKAAHQIMHWMCSAGILVPHDN